MRQINAILVLTLMSGLFSSFAGDKKQPRSLAADAIILAEKSGLDGWISGDVTFSMDDGKKKAKGKLFIHFSLDKGKASGDLNLQLDDGGKGKLGTPGFKYELVEKDSKRFIKILDMGEKGETKPKLRATVEYSLKSDELTIKGGVVPGGRWNWHVDLTKGVVFKEAKIDLPK